MTKKIIRKTSLKYTLLSMITSSMLPLYYLISRDKHQLSYFIMLILTVCFYMAMWSSSKVLIITEDKIIFRTGMKFKTFSQSEIDNIKVHSIHGSPLYLSIQLMSGDLIDIPRGEFVKTEVLQALSQWIVSDEFTKPY